MSVVIAIDAMGGDSAPAEIVKGALESLSDGDFKLILIGVESAIKRELAKYSLSDNQINRIEIVAAKDIIGNDESPVQAIRTKKDSSIVRGLNLLKDQKAQAFLSAGATGAVLTGATLIVGRVRGIERPALGTLLPNSRGFSFLIDSGANVDAKPQYLLQFASMGSLYMEHILSVKKPRVGLLNIGAEREKGNALTKEAYGLLEKSSDINFVGNVEARDVPLGAVDVVVCDAFAGNIVLKYTEGFAKAMMGMIKEELMSSYMSRIGALLAKDAFSNLKKRFDYREVGGAPLLGLKGLAVKAHGSSDSLAIRSALKQCVSFCAKDVVEKIARSIQK
ncbi:MAG: phosphate acyltransferase PlsX [Clostridiales bacterium]|jgi:glycerol-3-phosphate acyltransferase PlsX|nr:phosphate acyltransferase PlsX [Clostridiales bacterium]